MGNYVGNDPNGVDLFMSDDYTSNSSKLIASTKCVYKAVQALSENSIQLSSVMSDTSDTSWNVKFDNGLILQSNILDSTDGNAEVQFKIPFATDTYMIIGLNVISQSKTGFISESVTKPTRYLAIGF